MIRDRMVRFKNRLFRINNEEPLSKLSICVIIALDIFILFVIFSGLKEHTRQLTSPAEYVPYDCREVFIQHGWTEANRISKLQKMVLSDYHHYSYQNSRFDSSRIGRMHPVCREFYAKIRDIAADKKIFELFKKREQLETEKKQFTSGFKQTKDVYDTSLLETIAKKDNNASGLPSISGSMKDKSRQIEQLNQQISNIDKDLNAEARIQDLWNFLAKANAGRRTLLVQDLKKFEFWYPLKELLWQLVFLLPLFILFYVWNMRSVKKDAGLQILISAHLLVISAIPIFFKIIDVVLDLIPKHFFKKFFKVLISLHIIAVWHYIVIMVAIGVALLAIYIIQKKIFNRHRLGLKRLARGMCHLCGKKLPPDADSCPFCGTRRYTACPSCNEPTFIAGDFCARCGKPVR